MKTEKKPEKYLIRHIKGSKANQIEEFNFSNYKELTFGRSPDSTIIFDPKEDSVVSRQHGKIILENENPYLFKIADSNSRNGIFVNNIRVKTEAPIKSGDRVQLGKDGPSFIFEIFPVPSDLMDQTRIIDIPSSVNPTEEMKIEAEPTIEAEEQTQQKVGVGKNTVERLITSERKSSRQTLFASLAGLVIVLSALGFVFKDKIFPEGKTIIMKDSTIVQQLNSKSLIEVEDISTNERKNVVKINFSWRLYLSNTNEMLWHEFRAEKLSNGDTHYFPLFVQTTDGSIEPKLTKDLNVPRLPVGAFGATGTGFVITEDGFILTNSHVATNWNTRYSFPQDIFPGYLVNERGEKLEKEPMVDFNRAFGWVPQETRQFGFDPTNKAVKGSNTYLNVVFADNDTPIPVIGEPIPSPEHDVALIKINSTRKLSHVVLDENSEVKIGAPTVVMGYPGITPQTFSIVTSKNTFNTSNQVREIAKPTTTTGTVTNILEGAKLTGIERQVGSAFGEAYQLQISETGGGNSGGPVYNKDGKVIGIFYAGSSEADGTKVTYAIPIKYGTKLLNIY